MTSIRTRFAPSPTGFLHIGGLRTALYSYAFAKNQGGKFILRIEDTDRRRLVPGATEEIYQILKTFGLNWDEEPYIQSQRVKTGIYQKYAEQLIKQGQAYYCNCPPVSKETIKESQQKKKIILRDPCREKSIKKTDQPLAIRLKVFDNEKISYYDFVLKKEISWETKNIDEVMLLKSDGFPTYHLAVVVDDALMKISHIIRGRDWLPSTPVHLLLFKYLNFSLPEIGHLTDILDPAGGKLSKRRGAVSCEEFLTEGYLPEAILNFIMLLGWAPKDNREIFSLTDFVKEFSKGTLQVANPVFNRKKLDWFNGYYIRQKTNQQLEKLLSPFAPKRMSSTLIKQTIPLAKERMVRLSDFSDLTDFLVREPKVKINFFEGDKKLIKKQLTEVLSQLEKVKNWQAENLEKALRDLAVENSWHVGKFFMAVRIAVTGKTITPPLFGSLEILGRKETLTRLAAAQAAVSGV